MKEQGYTERLAEFVASRRDTPYAYGTNDCVLYAFDAIEAMNGVDLIAELRGTWTDEASANTVLEAQGGLVAAVDARLPRREKAFMQRGDICAVLLDGEYTLAVCLGQYSALPHSEGSLLISSSSNKIRICWEV